MAVDTLLIDNYDSFTYNLYQYLSELGADVVVHRNDQITLEEIEALEPERIVISPGPKTPVEAGVSVPVLQRFSPTIPTLGVCLGHQAIGAAFGATVGPAGEIRHGKVSSIEHDGEGVFSRTTESDRGDPLSLPDRRAGHPARGHRADGLVRARGRNRPHPDGPAPHRVPD